MKTIEQAFLAQSRRLLTDSYLPRIEKSVEGLSDGSSFARRPHPSWSGAKDGD